MADRWLAFEGNLEAAHADFPSWMYVHEINDNLDSWWAQWSYGSIHQPGVLLDAAYAGGHLAVEEPFYVKVSRPLPQFANHLDLERRTWGYQFRNRETGVVVWENRCPDNDHLRVFASLKWVLDTLATNNLLWAFDIRVMKDRREKARWGYSLAEERVWVIRAVIDHTGQIRWGSSTEAHQEFDAPYRG